MYRLFIALKRLAKSILPIRAIHIIRQNEVLLAKLYRFENHISGKKKSAEKTKQKIIFGE